MIVKFGNSLKCAHFDVPFPAVSTVFLSEAQQKIYFGFRHFTELFFTSKEDTTFKLWDFELLFPTVPIVFASKANIYEETRSYKDIQRHEL